MGWKTGHLPATSILSAIPPKGNFHFFALRAVNKSLLELSPGNSEIGAHVTPKPVSKVNFRGPGVLAASNYCKYVIICSVILKYIYTELNRRARLELSR